MEQPTNEQAIGFLQQWINKAVQNGGFNAQEAHDAVAIIAIISDRLGVRNQATADGRDKVKKKGNNS